MPAAPSAIIPNPSISVSAPSAIISSSISVSAPSAIVGGSISVLPPFARSFPAVSASVPQQISKSGSKARIWLGVSNSYNGSGTHMLTLPGLNVYVTDNPIDDTGLFQDISPSLNATPSALVAAIASTLTSYAGTTGISVVSSGTSLSAPSQIGILLEYDSPGDFGNTVILTTTGTAWSLRQTTTGTAGSSVACSGGNNSGISTVTAPSSILS